MPESLRSVWPAGSTRWAVRRAQWRSMGIPAEDFAKPKIAVVNSSSGLSSCYAHLDGVSEVVQRAVREAGGLPFEIRTIAPSDFITSAAREGRYLMPSRDLLVNDIEVMVEGALLDGMICLASCDKTAPAQLMAAARLDIPTIVVVCGYQVGAECHGRFVDIDDVYEAVGAVATGASSLPLLTDMTEVAVQGPGVCAGLGTANSMHILAEALGMALPGSAPVRAGSDRMFAFAREAGHRAVQLVADGPRPREILTVSALENAVRVAIAVGASVNTVRHLAAIATEAELGLDVVDAFERLGRGTHLLCAVRPNGPVRTEELEAAGGALGVMKQLGPALAFDARSVNGLTIGEVIARAPQPDEAVIRGVDEPVSRLPGLAIIRGSLAPSGAIVKLAAYPEEKMVFEGPAKVFASEADALVALVRGGIGAGDVVILAGLGAKGGPGTVFAAGFVAALNGTDLAGEVALVTDGELSGLNRGVTVGQVMPEAAEGGPLAAARNGDQIRIDMNARVVDLLVDPAEVERRLATWCPPEPPPSLSWLRLYSESVGTMRHGAVVGAATIEADSQQGALARLERPPVAVTDTGDATALTSEPGVTGSHDGGRS